MKDIRIIQDSYKVVEKDTKQGYLSYVNKIKCAVCGAGDKTLLNREGKYICRDCYAKILELRIMKGM